MNNIRDYESEDNLNCFITDLVNGKVLTTERNTDTRESNPILIRSIPDLEQREDESYVMCYRNYLLILNAESKYKIIKAPLGDAIKYFKANFQSSHEATGYSEEHPVYPIDYPPQHMLHIVSEILKALHSTIKRNPSSAILEMDMDSVLTDVHTYLDILVRKNNLVVRSKRKVMGIKV